jgi:hypothetical protein
MADQTLFEVSSQTFSDQTPFIDKKVFFVTDSNSGSYNSGQIIIETSSLSNSGRWCDYNSAVIHVPLVCTVNQTTHTGAVSSVANRQHAMFLGHKGWHNFLESIQITVNNKEIVQSTSRINQYLTFKLLSTMSQDDLEKHGSTLGWWPDSASHLFFEGDNAGSAFGIGVCNNLGNKETFNVDDGLNVPTSNEGLLKRQIFSNNDLERPNISLPFTNNAIGRQTARNHVQAVDNNLVYFWDCQLRLRDLSSFFANAGLLRGSYIRIQMTLNTMRYTFFTMGGGDRGLRFDPTLPAPQANGSTCPLMFSSTLDGAGAERLPSGADGNNYPTTIQAQIAQATVGANTYRHPLTSARLYVDTFTMNPVAESDYLTMTPTMMIPYNDVYQYQIVNIAAGSTFSQMLTNGISFLTGLLILPYYAAGQHNVGGEGANAVYLSEALSPFDSAPNTTLPYGALTNLQIQVGGSNLTMEYTNYEFEHWLNELRHTGLNGDVVENLRSGLVSYDKFVKSNRLYYFDIGRRLPEEDAVPRSILVQGTNSTRVPIDLQVYCIYKKRLSVATSDGSVISQG